MQPGWKEKKEIEAPAPETLEEQERVAGNKKQRSTWAKLIKRVYSIDPLICPRLHAAGVSIFLENGEARKKRSF